MTKLTIQNLKELINQRIEDFKKEYLVVSCYNDEQQTKGDYNGRQILELIQNADDAKAENISFELNKDKNELVFYNDGAPFDLEGIKSIMIAHNSSKVTSSYIGNKGLGFRSILNWAESISIYSAGLKIDFSQQVLKEYLENELKCLDLEAIRKSRNLSSDCIPMPILGLPRVVDCKYSGCDENKGCALVIKYDKEKENDVIQQILSIDKQTLLFLQSIKQVKVPCFKSTNIENCISVDRNEWEIHAKDEELEEKYQDKNKNEKRKYSIKIAIPTDGLLKTESTLYNYLPSKESVHLPFLLHATVELNSSRNHVNESNVNDFILEKAAELICEIANEHLTKTQCCPDWIAYRMMTPTVPEKDYGSLKALYARLDELKKDMVIYPTVGNQYATANDFCYYNDDISEFWKDFGGQGQFCPKMLQRIVGGFEIARKPLPSFVDAITVVSRQLNRDIENRVRLIRHLYDNRNAYNMSLLGQTKVPLLIDNNHNIIEGEAYVQDSGDEALTQDLPSWVEFKVVCNDLVKELIKVFSNEIDDAIQQKKRDGLQSVSVSRCLVGLLDFVDIHYFDKTGIANQVVSQTNSKLNNDTTRDKSKLIGGMLNFLYQLNSEAKLKSVKLLDADGNVVEANKLMLPTVSNIEVFGNAVQYVKALDEWRNDGYIENLDEEDFKTFMRKLGVNQLLDEKKLKDVFDDEYQKYLLSHKVYNSNNKLENCTALKNGSGEEKYQTLLDSIIQILKSLNLQKVLQFITSNEEVLNGLKENIKFWFAYNRNLKEKPTPYNYIRYQLASLPCVKWKVFASDLILDDAVDLDVLNRNVADAIDAIRTDFYYESTSDIQVFLNKSPGYFPNGKDIRKLYKLIIEGLADSDKVINEVQLYASDVDGNKAYHPSTEVFYSDNTCMPKKVIEEMKLYRLDYSSRQGVEKITRIFGLTSLNNLSFEIKDKRDSAFNAVFCSFFKKLKPYFLLYAIQNATKQSAKKTITENIKNCTIHLVSGCKYSIDNGAEKELEDGEFVNEGNVYYLNVGVIPNLGVMQSSPLYCNAIAEILGMAFKLETKNENFIHVFQGFDFMKKYIDENRKDEIEDCFKLLGLSTEERVFWEKYGELKELPLDFESLDFYSSVGFNEEVTKKVNFSQWDNQDSINFLKNILDTLETEAKKKALLGGVDLSLWHKLRFETIKTEYHKAFVHLIWTLLNGQYENMRSKYFTLQDDYSKLELNADGWKHELKEPDDYYECLNKKVNELLGQNGMSKTDKLDKESCEEHDNLYPHLIHSIQEEKDMENQRWLLYFEGNDEKIMSCKNEISEVGNASTADATNDVTNVTGAFASGRVMPSTSSTTIHGRGGRKSSTHTTMTDRRKAQKGEDSEKKVDAFLRKENIEHEWVSKTNDSAGYDFVYIVDGQRRLLEVKSSSDNSFILSANEYAVANSNKDVYDIAIVTGDNVTIYKAFFDGKPSMTPSDYYVIFDVKPE